MVQASVYLYGYQIWTLRHCGGGTGSHPYRTVQCRFLIYSGQDAIDRVIAHLYFVNVKRSGETDRWLLGDNAHNSKVTPLL